MTEPLTPPDCNCQGLPFMPLEVQRLMDSDFVALSTGDEFKAGFILWAKSWAQMPAASIPDDDRILAHWTGRSLAEWSALKDMALRGWVRCSDGRLYHPVIADLALTAAQKRRGQAAKANSRWARVRAQKGGENAEIVLGDEISDATASKTDAETMQGKGKVEEKESPLSPLGGNEQETDRKKPKRSIPKDFPDERAILEAKEQARVERSDVEVYYQAERFRNWALGKDARYADWAATWRNWIAKACREAPKLPPAIIGSLVLSEDPWRRRCQVFLLNDRWEEDWGPRPGREGCKAPLDLLNEFGIAQGHPDLLRRKALHAATAH